MYQFSLFLYSLVPIMQERGHVTLLVGEWWILSSFQPLSPMYPHGRDTRALGPRGRWGDRLAGRPILGGECESAEPCREDTTKHPKDVARRNRQCEPRNKSHMGRRHHKKASRRHTETHMCASHVNDWTEDGKLSVGRVGSAASKGDGPDEKGLVDCPAKLQCTRPGGHYHRFAGRPFSGQQRRNEEAKGGGSHARYVQCASKSVLECGVPEHLHLLNVRGDVPRKGEENLDSKHAHGPDEVKDKPVVSPQEEKPKDEIPVQAELKPAVVSLIHENHDTIKSRGWLCCRRVVRTDCEACDRKVEPMFKARKVRLYYLQSKGFSNIGLLLSWFLEWVRFLLCLTVERKEAVRSHRADVSEFYSFLDRDSGSRGHFSLVPGPYSSQRSVFVYTKMLKALRKLEWRLLERVSVNADGTVEATFLNATLRIASQIPECQKWREHDASRFFDTIAYFVQHSIISHNYLRQCVPSTAKPVFRREGRALTLWSACTLIASLLWSAISTSLMYIMTFLTLYLVWRFLDTLTMSVLGPADFGDLWGRPPWEGGPTEYQIQAYLHAHCLSGQNTWGGCQGTINVPSAVWYTVSSLFR